MKSDLLSVSKKTRDFYKWRFLIVTTLTTVRYKSAINYPIIIPTKVADSNEANEPPRRANMPNFAN